MSHRSLADHLQQSHIEFTYQEAGARIVAQSFLLEYMDREINFLFAWHRHDHILNPQFLNHSHNWTHY